MRRAARIDANQPAIVAALRAAGATVAITSAMGDGFPDLVVGFQRATVLIEVKDGQKPPSDRGLTEDQVKWHGAWTGGPVAIVLDVEGALRAIQIAAAGAPA